MVSKKLILVLLVAMLVVAAVAEMTDVEMEARHGKHGHKKAHKKMKKLAKKAGKCKCKKVALCYENVRACRNNNASATFKKAKKCLSNGFPVYSCSDSPNVCRSSSTCRPIRNGSGVQDPHFRGFDDSQYYFDGYAGRDYNIISDTNFQVNAQFIRLHSLKGTYMGRIGMLVGAHAIGFDPHFGVFLNGSQVTSGLIELPEADVLVELIDEHFRLTVRTDVWQVVARTKVERGLISEAYVNLHVSLLGTPEDPHGILGQTARFLIDPSLPSKQEHFKVAGEESDYEVHDGLFGTDFTFNRFHEAGNNADEPITVTGYAAGRRDARSLFEAAVDM